MPSYNNQVRQNAEASQRRQENTRDAEAIRLCEEDPSHHWDHDGSHSTPPQYSRENASQYQIRKMRRCIEEKNKELEAETRAQLQAGNASNQISALQAQLQAAQAQAPAGSTGKGAKVVGAGMLVLGIIAIGVFFSFTGKKSSGSKNNGRNVRTNGKLNLKK